MSHSCEARLETKCFEEYWTQGSYEENNYSSSAEYESSTRHNIGSNEQNVSFEFAKEKHAHEKNPRNRRKSMKTTGQLKKRINVDNYRCEHDKYEAPRSFENYQESWIQCTVRLKRLDLNAFTQAQSGVTAV